MGQLQQTLDGQLLTPNKVRQMRYTPEAPIHQYYVQFYTDELVEPVVERVRIEDRDINGYSPYERALHAAAQQSYWPVHEPLQVQKRKKLDTKRSDERRAEEFIKEFEALLKSY